MKGKGVTASLRITVLFLVFSTGFLLSSCGYGPGGCPEAYGSHFQYPSTGMNSIILRGSYDSQMSIDVVAATIANTAKAISFNLDFDSTKMAYDSYSTGTFFEQNENFASYSVNLDPGNNNKLTINISQGEAASGVAGNGVIVTLNFKLLAEGSSDVIFSNNHLLDSNGQDVTIDGWFGLSVIISRSMCN